MTDRPRWLDEEPEILDLLHRLLDKLDRKPAADWKQPPSLPLDERHCPALFRLDPAADREWALLQSLEHEHHLLAIPRGRRRNPYDPEFAGARMVFDTAAEQRLRDWLQRPRREPYGEQWRAALTQAAASFPGDAAQFLGRPLRLPGRSAEDLIGAFATVGELAGRGLTLRQLSARCFWGQSKFLDQRTDLVRGLFPGFEPRPRPLLLSLYLPERPQGLLLIENQDSYANALDGRPGAVRGLALGFGAGFRGSAERIRSPAGARLHFSRGTPPATLRGFEDWWFSQESAPWPLWFWGDLDYAGMAILRALRQRFPGMRAWEPGYAPLLATLRTGGGHPLAAAGKEGQSDPGDTGCPYADRELLPALRASAAGVDQEWLD
jgi:hypothetical protein